MRGVAVSLWLSAVEVAVALFVGNLLAKRIAVMITQTAWMLRW